jgi:hypothetical protein
LNANQQNVLVDGGFITDSGDPSILIVPNGIWHAYVYFSKQAINNNLNVYYVVSKYSTGGIKTTLFTSSQVPIEWDTNNSTPVEIKINALATTAALDISDRIILDLYVNNNDNQSRTVTFYTEGSTSYSYLVTTLGPASSSGTSGSSGSSGSSGTSGSSGSSGSSGTSGTSGSSGSSGSSGTSGTGFSTVANYGSNRILVSDNTPDGATAQSDLTWDGNVLAITSVTFTGLTTSGIIVSIGATSYDAGYFDYVISEAGGAKRAGTVIAVWDSSSATFTDYSTVDLNNSTNSFAWNVQVSGGNLNLVSQISSGTWSVKIGSRVI